MADETNETTEQAMFRERGELYDRIYHWKDYAAEAARVRGVLAAAGIADGARVLETGCGTGAYLVHLARHYAVSGLDVNEGILAVARRKLPDVPFVRADMADFALGAPVDALVCLFSSIGYVEPSRLPDAARCAFRALRPGGVAIVEAWLLDAEIRRGFHPATVYEGSTAKPPEDLTLVRCGTHLIDGGRSIFDFHWIVATSERTEHFVDRHVLWILTPEELCAPFRAAGFDVTWLHPGPISGRGTVLARRPAER